MSYNLYTAAQEAKEDALKHYGVVGMRWGIRRYQNPDGTLTELGKKHQAEAEKAIAKWEKKKERAIAKGDRKFAEKHLDVLTNQDIQRFTERIRSRNSISNLRKEAESIKAEKFKNWLNTASNVVQNVSNMSQNGVNLYNTVAKINNSFSKSKMTLIGEKADDPNKWTSKTVSYTDDKGRKVTETYGKKGN